MDSISWLDTVRASVSTCLPCLPSTSDPFDSEYTNRRRPPQHLEALLADNGTDTEAETVSLHSNLGDHRNKRRKQKKKRVANLTFFGYDLFGKRPGVQLEDEENDGLLARNINSQRQRQRASNSHSSSSYTFDSDAAPLDSAAIDQMTPELLEARAREAEARQEEERLAKEERRRKRREKKEVRKLAEALARQRAEGGEFEGFQGSGGNDYRAIPSPLLRGNTQGSVSGSEGSGSFTKVHRGGPAEGDDDADAADLDGQLYTRSSTRSYSDRASDSRRSPSDVSSSIARQSHHPIQQQPGATTMSVGSDGGKKKKRSKTRSSKVSETTSDSSRQAPSSLASPVRNTFEGFTPKKEAFPSTGLGRPQIVKTSSGVFLANRGDDLDDDIHGL